MTPAEIITAVGGAISATLVGAASLVRALRRARARSRAGTKNEHFSSGGRPPGAPGISSAQLKDARR
jgi:hypothetical protein